MANAFLRSPMAALVCFHHEDRGVYQHSNHTHTHTHTTKKQNRRNLEITP